MKALSTVCATTVIARVMESRQAFIDRQKKKVAKDAAAEESKPDEYKNVRET